MFVLNVFIIFVFCKKIKKNMNKISTYLFLILFAFVSVDIMSQSIKVSEIRSKNQLISGINIAPNTSKLQKAVPISITNNHIDNHQIIEKKAIIGKPLKVSKYNNTKAKRDED